MRLAERRHGGEVEGGEGLAGWQAGLGEVALDASAGAIGEFQFGECGEQARGGPSLLVGAGGDVGPEAGDGGQAEFAEHQRQARHIGGAGGGHAAAPTARRAS